MSVSSHKSARVVMPMLITLRPWSRTCCAGALKITRSSVQMDLLGDKNQDMLLEEALGFVEAKETGKRSASRLLLPHMTQWPGAPIYI